MANFVIVGQEAPHNIVPIQYARGYKFTDVWGPIIHLDNMSVGIERFYQKWQEMDKIWQI